MTHLLAALRDTTLPVCQGPLCDSVNGEGFSKVMGVAIQMIFIVAGLLTLLFLFMGGIEYITSGGDKEKTAHARDRIMHAAIGLVIVVVAYTLWVVIVSDVLGIFGTGGAIKLPTLGQ